MLYLEIVWKLGASSVARIHSDEDSAGGVQFKLSPFKHQHLSMGSNSWTHRCGERRGGTVCSSIDSDGTFEERSAVSKGLHY